MQAFIDLLSRDAGYGIMLERIICHAEDVTYVMVDTKPGSRLCYGQVNDWTTK